VDMHAKDVVGINGITRVLLLYSCQQGVYPRGHVLPLRLHMKKTTVSIRPEVCSILRAPRAVIFHRTQGNSFGFKNWFVVTCSVSHDTMAAESLKIHTVKYSLTIFAFP
jgi:hypothetical protein